MTISVPQFSDATTPLASENYLYLLQGTGLDRDRKVTLDEMFKVAWDIEVLNAAGDGHNAFATRNATTGYMDLTIEDAILKGHTIEFDSDDSLEKKLLMHYGTTDATIGLVSDFVGGGLRLKTTDTTKQPIYAMQEYDGGGNTFELLNVDGDTRIPNKLFIGEGAGYFDEVSDGQVEYSGRIDATNLGFRTALKAYNSSTQTWFNVCEFTDDATAYVTINAYDVLAYRLMSASEFKFISTIKTSADASFAEVNGGTGKVDLWVGDMNMSGTLDLSEDIRVYALNGVDLNMFAQRSGTGYMNTFVENSYIFDSVMVRNSADDGWNAFATRYANTGLMDVFVNDLGHLNSIYCSQNSHVWAIPSTNRVDLDIDSLDTYGTILSHGNIRVAGIGGVGAADFVVRNDTTGKADLWVGDLNATGDLDITGDVTADDLVATNTLRVGADANVAYLERSGRLMVAPYGITGGFSTSTSTNDVTKYLSKGEIVHTNTRSPASMSFETYSVYLPEQPSDGEEHTIVRTANSIEWLLFDVSAQNGLQIRKGASLYTNYNMYGTPGVNICQITLKYSANTAEWIITSQFSF